MQVRRVQPAYFTVAVTIYREAKKPKCEWIHCSGNQHYCQVPIHCLLTSLLLFCSPVIFACFFVAVLQSCTSPLRLILPDESRSASESTSLVPRPHPRQEARAGGARGWLVYVWEWKKRALPISHDLLPSNKPEEHSDPAFGIATNELEIEAGTFCLSIFLGDCLYTNLMRSRLAWVFDGGAKIWSTILGQVTIRHANHSYIIEFCSGIRQESTSVRHNNYQHAFWPASRINFLYMRALNVQLLCCWPFACSKWSQWCQTRITHLICFVFISLNVGVKRCLSKPAPEWWSE